MAFTLLWGTGFEHGSVSCYPAGSGGTISTTSPCTGTYCMYQNQNTWINTVFTTGDALSELYLSAWLKPAYGDTSRYWEWGFRLSDNYIIGVQIAADMLWMPYINTSRIGGYSTLTHTNNQWHNLMLYVKIADSPNGIIQTKLDGVLDVNYTGDTKPGSASYITQIYSHCNFAGYVDDIAVGSGGWPDSDIRFTKLVPTADTAEEDWVPSTGSDSYALVDEVGPNDADYISSAVNGDRTLFDLGDFDGTGKTIAGISHFIRVWKSDAVADQVKLLTKSGSTEDAETFDISTSVTYKGKTLAVNPDDSAAWEDADLDALQVGVESIIV